MFSSAPSPPHAVSTEKPVCFVRTVLNRCRVCYTCVRRCPAKAIRIAKQQAEVMPERCVGCGNCVRVCSQGAKEVVTTLPQVEALLASGEPVAACVAPSFPAELRGELDFRVFAGMIAALGFRWVTEVAFGADLVSERYRRLLLQHGGKPYVATSCPAVVGFVERYYPDQVEQLAPVVSPMIAMARVLRRIHGPKVRVVFIGPCVAKKVESIDEDVAGEVDAAITFRELRELISCRGISPETVEPRDFDPPHPRLGAAFPVSRGLLQSAGLSEDLLHDEVVAADGLTDFTCALEEFATGSLDVGLLELLSCSGCIAGPGLSHKDTLFRRRAWISQYLRYRMGSGDKDDWQRDIDRFAGLDLTRGFRKRDQRVAVCSEEEIEKILGRMGKTTRADELNCGACGYQTCREHAVAIYKGLAESEMCLPFVIDEFQKTIHELSLSHEQLATTQEQLMHSEKLASMGQLAAGVAHELNNPLGVVLMYAHLLLEEQPDSSPVHGDLKLIAEQADRCKRIVGSLLDFARENKVLLQAVDVRDLVERAIGSVPKADGIEVVTELGHASPVWELDPDQMIQVLTNLISNSYGAMPNGGQLAVRTGGDKDTLVISVTDTGCGIPQEHMIRLFSPFFTTKKFGKGTGLGLAVTYGIVKMHRGSIDVNSNADPSHGPTGTTFTVRLPRRPQTD
ncbi:MAG: [Fe-Fe] hydrogenase large subunit C-terminal domain-containing protein [Polyangia bacterium]|nr:[Fe-Fe] hydrogenase large subunit C-terminal domain-containing protein [Polyangia bacterium]